MTDPILLNYICVLSECYCVSVFLWTYGSMRLIVGNIVVWCFTIVWQIKAADGFGLKYVLLNDLCPIWPELHKHTQTKSNQQNK